MAIFGPQGIRDSVRKSYGKHVQMYQAEPPSEGVSVHHASLHSTLVLRYAFAYRPMPEAIVWLEIGPLLELPEEDALSALAEYVVYKERPARADLRLLQSAVARGMDFLSHEDQEFFFSAACQYRFQWKKLWAPASRGERVAESEEG